MWHSLLIQINQTCLYHKNSNKQMINKNNEINVLRLIESSDGDDPRTLLNGWNNLKVANNVSYNVKYYSKNKYVQYQRILPMLVYIW